MADPIPLQARLKYTGLSDPSDFKDSALKELDRLLRCPICYDFYTTPLILPCSHSFCSLCIRRYLQYKNSCPACMQVTSVSGLVNNMVLEQITNEFTKNRSTILNVCRPVSNNTEVVAQPTDLAPPSLLVPSNQYSTRNDSITAESSKLIEGKKKCHDEKVYFNSEIPNDDDVHSLKPHPKNFAKTTVKSVEANPKANLSGSQPQKLVSSVTTNKIAGTSPSIFNPQVTDTVSNNADASVVSMPPINFVLESETIEGLNLDSDLVDDSPVLSPLMGSKVKQEQTTEDLDKMYGSRDLTPPLLGGGSSPPDYGIRAMCFGDYSQQEHVVRGGAESVVVKTGEGDTGTHVSLDRTPDLKCKSVDMRSMLENEDRRDIIVDSAECPVCGLQILNKHMNNHLDICLKYSSTRQQQSNPSNKSPYVLPKLPKLCYTVMKDSQLRQKLKEYHLSSTGSRSILISRLKEFQLQYNAQYDSANPKTIKEIAAEVESMERAKSSTPRRKQTFGAHLSRNSTMEEVEQECKKYVMKHTDQFENLISGVRKRLMSSEDVGVSDIKESPPLTDDVGVVKPLKRRKTMPMIKEDPDSDFEI